MVRYCFFVIKEFSNSLLDPLFFFRTYLLNHLPAWQSFDMRQMPVVAKIRPLKSQSWWWWWLQLCCGTLLLIKSTDNKNWPSNAKTTWWRKKKKGGRMLRKKNFLFMRWKKGHNNYHCLSRHLYVALCSNDSL